MKPQIEHSKIILGSFPPVNSYFQIGNENNYFIHDDYKPRLEPLYYNDTLNEDEWQVEVYQFAREIFDEYDLKSVLDIGCGSAYKLLQYFHDVKITGMDVPQTLDYLRKKYPERDWIDGLFKYSGSPELVIFADVIEHIALPNQMLNNIINLNPRYIVISTPDRNLLRVGTYNGPPQNSTHIREWSFYEFHKYIESKFDIIEHFISNPSQGTQCILCKPYAKS
jgi:SAM-dependent methyltransferase